MTDPPPTYQDLRFRDLENRAAGGRPFFIVTFFDEFVTFGFEKIVNKK